MADITCIIPTFNDRTYVGRAIASALQQAPIEVRVLLVDDRSDEPTRAYLAGLAEADPRVEVFFMPNNGGQSRARNVGAMLAETPFITFLDQDDEHAAGWYETAIRHLGEQPELAAISGHAEVVDLPERVSVADPDLRIEGLSLVFVNNIVFRRPPFLAIGGLPRGEIWRTRAAGEDGIFRTGFFAHWGGIQIGAPALIHHAREGGATVFFLDRSHVEDNRVVMDRLETIETNGELDAAQSGFLALAAREHDELKLCLK